MPLRERQEVQEMPRDLAAEKPIGLARAPIACDRLKIPRGDDLDSTAATFATRRARLHSPAPSYADVLRTIQRFGRYDRERTVGRLRTDGVFASVTMAPDTGAQGESGALPRGRRWRIPTPPPRSG